MITRTFDTDLIRDLLLSSSFLLERVTYDGDVTVFDPQNQEALYYLLVEGPGGGVLGFILFNMFNSTICYQGHVNYLPSSKKGYNLAKYTRDAITWMFENTECQSVIALAPENYPEVGRHAEKAGLNKVGSMPASSIYDGEIHGNTIYTISKEGFL